MHRLTHPVLWQTKILIRATGDAGLVASSMTAASSSPLLHEYWFLSPFKLAYC